MELYKTEYSNSRGKDKLDKVLINYKDTSCIALNLSHLKFTLL